MTETDLQAETPGTPAPPASSPGAPDAPAAPVATAPAPAMPAAPGAPGAAPAPHGPSTGPSGPRRAGGDRPAGRGGRKREYRGRYTPRRKVCQFCADKIPIIDYKDAGRLRRFLSERAKIEPRRKTGTCAHHQRALATAIKRARHVALLPFTAEHSRITGLPIR